MKSNLVKITKFHNIRNTILNLNDIYTKRSSIVAKTNRAKRECKVNPNIEKAQAIAREIWKIRSSAALLDVAYEIKSKLELRTSSTTIQEWIRGLNPNAKKKITK